MTILVSSSFAFSLDQPSDVLLQFEAAAIPEQRILSAETQIGQVEHMARVAAEEGIGERIWLRGQGRYQVAYTAQVEVQRLLADVGTLERLQPHHLPGEAVHYLLDSRYCPADRL